ncbi:dockerin type I repeat-containing protein [Ruminococcus flavefaciens]|uniref:Ig-like domain (Group 3) n=1 Tax=Ruminococcus flavefaciens TaxID=1265 RepID=A0A1M7J9J9_RUMFL|nr:dockerin type I repeat-containing protein [Ruminococcus flavefaciens]SHM49760.1 Ig-like domain (group 3) [Ruminococcus flavefaciens]
MLFKKLLSITLAAAMSASMLSAAPTTTTATVAPLNAIAADDTQEVETVQCMMCHKNVPKSEIQVASNGCAACYDCYPAASCCFPTITASASGIITAVDNDSVTLDKAGKYFFNAPLELQHLTNKLGHKPQVGEKLNMEYTYVDNPEHTDDHYIITFKSASTENDTTVTVEDNEVHGIAGVFDHAEDGYLYFINNEKYPYGESLAAVVNSLSKGNIINVTLSASDTIINIEKTLEGTTTATSVQTSITTTTTCINTTLPATTEYWKQYALSLIPPEKTEYNIGEELDFTGGSAYGTVYDSLGMLGDTFPQPIDSKYFKVDSSEFDNTKPGTYTIYVTYGEGEGMAKQSFKVTVRRAVTSQPVTTTTITTTLTAPVTSVKEYDRTSFRGTFDSYADCGSYKELYLSNGIKYTLSSLRLEGGLSDEKVTEILKSLNKGDNIIVTANQSYMAVNYLYDIFSIDLYSVTTHYNPSPTTTANVSYPYGGTNNDVPDNSTTYTEPERWMYGTGVDHFEKIKTIPTKTIYDEGEKLDLSGLVINAYHSVSRWSNKGNGETLRTDYIWNVTNIYPKYIKIESLDGDTSVSADEFNTLKGGTYIVKIGTDGSFKCNVEGESSDRTVYDTQSVEFSFIVYINSADKSAKLVKINNAEVTDFTIGSENGFVISNVGAYTINSCFDSDIRKGDIVSGNIYVSPDTNTIIRSELEVEEYSGDKGDANGDGSLDMGDVVLIMQSLANPNKYGENGTDAQHITKRGIALGDMNGDGISTLDALSIQRILLGIDPKPVSDNNHSEQPVVTTVTNKTII